MMLHHMEQADSTPHGAWADTREPHVKWKQPRRRLLSRTGLRRRERQGSLTGFEPADGDEEVAELGENDRSVTGLDLTENHSA